MESAGRAPSGVFVDVAEDAAHPARVDRERHGSVEVGGAADEQVVLDGFDRLVGEPGGQGQDAGEAVGGSANAHGPGAPGT